MKGLLIPGFSNAVRPFLSLFRFGVFLFIVLQGCNEFPEEKAKPYFVLKGDTSINQIKGFVLSGDTLEYWCSYASNSESNEIFFGSIRPKMQPVEYEGPDSVFKFQDSQFFNGKILDKSLLKRGIPSGILPGQYSFYAFMKNASGQRSDSGKFSFFVNSRTYPVLALDTPLNGILVNHLVNGLSFKVQMRGLGDRLSTIKWQWYDSLKVDTLAIHEKYSISDPALGGVVRSTVAFPLKKGRKFYLKTIVCTIEDRKIIWWIPFERTIDF